VAVNLVLLIALGVAVVALTRLVVRGIELYAAAGGMSSKAKGQFLGYATSLPELVGTVGTAGNGLLQASLWNVGASNVINVFLFLFAARYYRRMRALWDRTFIDEAAFAFGAFVVPLVLASSSWLAASPFTAGALMVVFGVYIYLDRKFNPNPPPSIQVARGDRPARPGKKRAISLVVVGVLGIILAGHYLGLEAKIVVEQMHVPQWGVGWILGVITSLPEMTAFFAVFASARVDGQPPKNSTDCQENIDSLTASNMSNLGLIYPIGIIVFLTLGM